MKKKEEIFLISMIILSNILFSGCAKQQFDNTDNADISDPNKAILGKWELVQKTRFNNTDEHKIKPTGYVEYLPDSILGWYDYATKHYTLLEGKYWIETIEEMVDIPTNPMIKYMILHFRNSRSETEFGIGYYLFNYYIDTPGFCDNFRFIFISSNQISLYQLCTSPIAEDYSYIYKRKK